MASKSRKDDYTDLEQELDIEEFREKEPTEYMSSASTSGLDIESITA